MRAQEPNDGRESNVTRRTVLRGALGTAAVAVLGTAVAGTAAGENKAELIDSIASDADVTENEVSRVFQALARTAAAALQGGDRVAIADFGTFSPPPDAKKKEKKKEKKKNKKHGRKRRDGAANAPPAVDFQSTREFAAKLDLVPGEGDQRRAASGAADEKKKDKKKRRRARWQGPEPDVVLDAALVASEPDLEKQMAERILDAFVDVAAERLVDGFDIPGIGAFSISKRSARKGRNPQTGKEIKIPAKKVVKFKPVAELSEKST